MVERCEDDEDRPEQKLVLASEGKAWAFEFQCGRKQNALLGGEVVQTIYVGIETGFKESERRTEYEGKSLAGNFGVVFGLSQELKSINNQCTHSWNIPKRFSFHLMNVC